MDRRPTYASAGFNRFFHRSIDSHDAGTLSEASSISSQTTGANEINFDQQQTNGSMGSAMKVGPNVKIDGQAGRISVFDGSNEVVTIGNTGQ